MIDHPFEKELVDKVIGGWRVHSYINQGASALVFYATKDQAVAALKVYKPEFVTKFGKAEQQSRIARQREFVGHPCRYLVQLYDASYCHTFNVYYVAMAFHDGRPLNAARLRADRIQPAIAQIAAAAEFLDSKSTAHRDIKPANIVVNRKQSQLILLDLGVIGAIDTDTITETSQNNPFVGTMRYSPPEFITRKGVLTSEEWRHVTFYQLGAVLHDMLTGKRMFADVPDSHWVDLLDAIRQREVVIHREDIPDFIPAHQSLIALANECLAKDPNDRRGVTWDRFRCHRNQRKPTIVVLYTGGTIGSAASQEDSSKRQVQAIKSVEDPILRDLRARLLRDYRQVHPLGESPPIDITWEIMDPLFQILSENANCSTWDALCEKLEAICCGPIFTARDRYLLGIIVLHGTDTMGYAAAAVALGLRNLPVPIVITGSNQPPNLQDIREHNIIASKSDAWKNLLHSLLFLEGFGHMLTEVFVCFAETVHHAINLQKLPIHSRAQLDVESARQLSEPYVFRNASMGPQYMFRNIDGIYCNNFYPTQLASYLTLFHESQVNYRHVRSNPLERDVSGVRRLSFAKDVWYVRLSPAITFDQLVRETKRLENCRAVLLEGYNSGTFPSDSNHSFSMFLGRLLEDAIPLVLVSPHGLTPTEEHYAIHKVNGRLVTCLRLYGITGETALPLLAVIMAQVKDAAWLDSLSEPDPQAARCKLIEQQIWLYEQQFPSLFGSVLGSVVHREMQRRNWESRWTRIDQDYSRIDDSLFGTIDAEDLQPLEGSAANRLMRRGYSRVAPYVSKTTILRSHFLWFIVGMVKPYDAMGCAPDGFGVINRMGFEWGTHTYEALARATRFTEHMPWSDRGADEAKTLAMRAKALILDLCKILSGSGIADIDSINVHISDPQSLDGCVLISVRVVKHGHLTRQDELFAARSPTIKSAELLALFAKGTALEEDDTEHDTHLRHLYEKIGQECWVNRLSALDWFILGVLKAAIVGILGELEFDSWTQRCFAEWPAGIGILRRSIHTNIRASDDKALVVEFRYVARDYLGSRLSEVARGAKQNA